ncbi:hypothetical protein LTR59_015472 [Friedmanniomyces endolithicus]|nr:hypothetical protein LTR94_018593 [Friedmanniomyces endolithicus]KAK0772917.1 hypothetical protein LTR59_015472 [Friedmanniomyces endolithicus]KAK0776883.1 hypothetical protein LTR38_015361 [Friedmanniomyces endolithicus]
MAAIPSRDGSPASEVKSSAAKSPEKPVFTEKEERVLKVAWQCLKSGPPDVDVEKLAKAGGFNTTKTASNTWGTIKKKLLAMAPPETDEGEGDGAGGTGGKRAHLLTRFLVPTLLNMIVLLRTSEDPDQDPHEGQGQGHPQEARQEDDDGDEEGEEASSEKKPRKSPVKKGKKAATNPSVVAAADDEEGAENEEGEEGEQDVKTEGAGGGEGGGDQ